ncbi:MAG TPA: 23S rRNA (adenine(2503)-C(2))-methyltransferase RlmN [Terriglobia bacterium]|nr:23S rRNA (adenine(2503)-C(2))-methyltransferase RlmN [Terriglobia bacterium]
MNPEALQREMLDGGGPAAAAGCGLARRPHIPPHHRALRTMPSSLPNLIGYSRAELEDLAGACGQPRYRGRQLYHGLYARLAADFSAFTDLARGLRERLAVGYIVGYPEVVREVASQDESVRYLLGLDDGEAVEAVYMPWRLERRQGRAVATPSGRALPGRMKPAKAAEPAEETGEPRTTLCISSQVGCVLDCKFCFTGQLGARRNLTAGEIVGQVLAIARARALWGAAKERDSSGAAAGESPALSARVPGNGPRRRPPRKARTSPRLNIVFMGQGEPLLNLAAVMKAVAILADTAACAVPLRRITISTAGMVPRIYDLAREPVRPKLAISLNASNDEQRSALMPINRKYPLGALLEACRAYPLRPREHLTFEYVMLDGVNDSDEDAERVARLLAGLAARVNLIPYNGGASLPFRSSPLERVYRYQHILRERGLPAFIRISRGQDIMAACGQLSLAGRA